TICSGLCLLRLIESLLAPAGAVDSHNAWISFRGAGHYTEADARKELDQAKKNRSAQAGIFVFSKATAPSNVSYFSRVGRDVFVVWDPADPASDVLLRASLSVARALVIREKAAADSTKADLTAIERHVMAI